MEGGERVQVLQPLSEDEICDVSKTVGTRLAPEFCADCEAFLQKVIQHQGACDACRRYGLETSRGSRFRRGCYLCLSISKAFKLLDDVPWQWVSVWAYPDMSLQINACSTRSWNDPHAGHEELEIYLGQTDDTIPLESSPSGDIWPSLTDVLPEFSRRPYCERSLDFLKHCLRQCLETHENCRQRQVAPACAGYPSRLLFVGSDAADLCKVVECHGSTGWTYAALSYCWGTSRFIQSNRRTYEKYKRAIPTTAIPNTFREAISICRKLSIRYLWIDSLCILQDNAHDWAIESAKMADIYEGALFVIAAATAMNPRRSFLNQREELRHDVLEIEPEAVGQHLPAVKARRRSITGWHKFSKMFVNNPLEARGWTLQERLLATRYISFVEGEVQWQCKTKELCECGAQDRNPDMISLTSGLSSSISTAWKLAVQSYSQKSLSYEQDKLPAIAGIATKISQMTGSSYICGLWRHSMIDDLCWSANPYGKPRYANRCGDYRAPTFSWASMDGAVRWHPLVLASRNAAHHIQIVEAACTLKNENAFGQVEDAHLMVDGYLLDATLDLKLGLHLNRMRVMPDNFNTRISRDSAELSRYFHCPIDTALDFTLVDTRNGYLVDVRRSTGRETIMHDKVDLVLGAPVKCLKIRTTVDEAETCVDLLVLSRSQRVSDAYERLGLVRFQLSNPADSMHPELETKIQAWLDTSGMPKTRLKLV